MVINSDLERTFVSKHKFLKYNEINSWLNSDEWKRVLRTSTSLECMSNIKITEEFYVLVKSVYDNIHNEKILKRLGELLYKDGLKLKQYNSIYEKPMKRMQDCYYLTGYCVGVLLYRDETMTTSVKNEILSGFHILMSNGFDGVGGWIN